VEVLPDSVLLCVANSLLDWELARGAMVARSWQTWVLAHAAPAHAFGASLTLLDHHPGRRRAAMLPSTVALDAFFTERGPPVDFASFASKERWEHEHNVRCEKCGFGGEILCCDFCNLVYHMGCLDPPLAVSSAIVIVPE
jgi:hypothetical protein